MYRTNLSFENDEAAAINSCADALLKNAVGKKVGIMAGHFMLMYSNEKDELLPCIWQESKGTRLEGFSKMMAGNFPTDTFVMGLKLRLLLIADGFEAKLILIVNDHKFQSRNFQPSISGVIKNRAGILRKNFYTLWKGLPAVFQQILLDRKEETDDVIMRNDDAKRKTKSLLPTNTLYFSEQVYQNRFDNYRMPRLLKKPEEFGIKRDEKKDIFLYLSELNQSVCLTDGGNCGCVGLTIELISDIFEKGIFTIVLFVPNECAEAVNTGIAAAMKLFERKSFVICVSNLGGMGKTIENQQYTNIKLTRHFYG